MFIFQTISQPRTLSADIPAAGRGLFTKRIQLQEWRANCDIQIIIDHHACVEYLAKYAAKGEPRSQQLKDTFNFVIKSADHDTNVKKAIKQLMMKSLGERDFSAQETAHHLLSLKLHSTTFN